MRTGHMTVLQSCRRMEFRVLQWCHPMLASTKRTSCCTRIITLYGTRKWIQARTMLVHQNVWYSKIISFLWVNANYCNFSVRGFLKWIFDFSRLLLNLVLFKLTVLNFIIPILNSIYTFCISSQNIS